MLGLISMVCVTLILIAQGFSGTGESSSATASQSKGASATRFSGASADWFSGASAGSSESGFLGAKVAPARAKESSAHEEIAVAYKKDGIFVPMSAAGFAEHGDRRGAVSGSKEPSRTPTVTSDAGKNGPIYKTLPEICKEALRYHFDQSGDSPSFNGLASRFKVTDNYKIRAGVFVTLVKEGKTRACWGSVTPIHGNLVEATIYATEDALTKDYRHEPITASEVEELKPQVTVVRKVVPIDSIAHQQALKFGLMVRSGGRGALLLPGEASDAYYQMVQCKLKAGIPVKEKCQLYRLETDVYR